MNATTLISAARHGLSGQTFRKFSKDESGAVMIFIVILFTMMLVVAGGAVDFMRQETERARLQDAVDRGSLAAASFTQQQNAQDTVKTYLDTARVPAARTVNVSLTNPTLYSQRVTTTATYTIRTFFLKIIGINTLQVAARAAAEQQRNKVEISLILDITPSMGEALTGGGGTKMDKLKTSAKTFIDAMLTDSSRAVTSINLIPFGGQTNPSLAVFNKYTNITNKFHTYSSCIDFTDADFNTLGFATNVSRTQTQHFQADPMGSTWGWCPSEVSSMIPMSNNNTVLKQRITDMGMHGWTGIQNGLKWGTVMLDPSSQTMVTSLISGGKISSEFAGRPAAYNATGTLKFVVLMTDGEMYQQIRVKTTSYDTASERTKWASTKLPASGSDTTETTSKTLALNQMSRLCTAAKASGVVIFTIGFQVNDAAATVLKNCATNEAYFYRVEGLEIATAFQAIARTIETVKLVL